MKAFITGIIGQDGSYLAELLISKGYDMAEYTGNITGLGTTRILDAIRRSGIKTRFYKASSSEMFGASPPPKSENAPFYPRSLYAAVKIYPTG